MVLLISGFSGGGWLAKMVKEFFGLRSFGSGPSFWKARGREGIVRSFFGGSWKAKSDPITPVLNCFDSTLESPDKVLLCDGPLVLGVGCPGVNRD